MPPPATPSVTTLDLLKVFAVATMLADHVGLYFLTDQTWWRAAGRPTIVIFGFLIGFAGPRTVPPLWIGLGLGLTLLEGWTDTGDEGAALDTLISLALARLSLPFFVWLMERNVWLLLLAAIAAALLAESTNQHLEYGTEVLMFALFGLACRGAAPNPTARVHAMPTGLAAMVGYLVISHRHFEFGASQTAAVAVVLAGLIVVLLRFETRPIKAALNPPLAAALRFAGQYTLEIYAIHLALFMIASWWFEIE
jgi:hypothetical protein